MFIHRNLFYYYNPIKWGNAVLSFRFIMLFSYIALSKIFVVSSDRCKVWTLTGVLIEKKNLISLFVWVHKWPIEVIELLCLLRMMTGIYYFQFNFVLFIMYCLTPSTKIRGYYKIMPTADYALCFSLILMRHFVAKNRHCFLHLMNILHYH